MMSIGPLSAHPAEKRSGLMRAGVKIGMMMLDPYA
jgi:hypothetical protein